MKIASLVTHVISQLGMLFLITRPYCQNFPQMFVSFSFVRFTGTPHYLVHSVITSLVCLFIFPSHVLLTHPEFSESLILVSQCQSATGTEHIYLGPHGAPPQYGRGGQETSTPNRKQRLKQKLKDAERKSSASSRENKVEVLQDLMGTKPGAGPNPRGGSESEWLDPYCHESQFERPANRA